MNVSVNYHILSLSHYVKFSGGEMGGEKLLVFVYLFVSFVHTSVEIAQDQ